MSDTSPTARAVSERRRWIEVLIASAVLAVAGVGVVTVLTHVVGPRLFTHYERFPALAQVPKRSVNAKGVEGDPINVAIVATSDSALSDAMRRAGWVEAQPVTRASSIGIAKSVLLNRPDSSAPVSPLYLFGRQQDHAFEREAGPSARSRHHVRLWLAKGISYQSRPVWIGGASFDTKAGISHRGLHPTHHIDPDVDRERDQLGADLARASVVADAFHVTGYGFRIDAHNAEGDRFDTDGELLVLVFSPGAGPSGPLRVEPDPWRIAFKERVARWLHR